MGIGIGATTSSPTTTTGTTTDPNAAPASEEPAPVEDTYDTAEPNAWGTFVEGTPGAAAPIAMNDTAGPAMDFSADAIAEVPATAGASLGTLSDPAGDPVAALGGVVDSANMTATTDEVDALIASEQGTLDAVYGALETAPTEVKSELISGLTQLSELAGPTGQTALADGVVGAMELDRDMSETNQDIIGAMGESVYEGEGATLMANVTTGLLRAEGDYAGYYGTISAEHMVVATDQLRRDFEGAASEYGEFLVGYDEQAKALPPDQALAHYEALAANPEFQTLQDNLQTSAERYRSVQAGAATLLNAPELSNPLHANLDGLRDQAMIALGETPPTTAVEDVFNGVGSFVEGRVTDTAGLVQGAWGLTIGRAYDPEGAAEIEASLIETAGYISDHPEAVLQGLVQPYVDAWSSGHPGEAVGLLGAEIAAEIVGSKGLGTITRAMAITTKGAKYGSLAVDAALDALPPHVSDALKADPDALAGLTGFFKTATQPKYINKFQTDQAIGEMTAFLEQSGGRASGDFASRYLAKHYFPDPAGAAAEIDYARAILDGDSFFGGGVQRVHAIPSQPGQAKTPEFLVTAADGSQYVVEVKHTGSSPATIERRAEVAAGQVTGQAHPGVAVFDLSDARNSQESIEAAIARGLGKVQNHGVRFVEVRLPDGTRLRYAVDDGALIPI